VKERPIIFSAEMVQAIRAGTKTQTRRVIKPQPDYIPEQKNMAENCPYGEAGDRLWVRETFRIYNSFEECTCYDDCSCHKYHGKPIYRADMPDAEARWTPSIFMPRKYSRILLEIDNIRVELLQDISEQDAIREGVTCRDAFRELWTVINENWESNPFVWILEFHEVKP